MISVPKHRGPQMPLDDSLATMKDESSSSDTSSAETWWDKMRKPSRQRNLSPSERKALADDLRALRQARHREERGESNAGLYAYRR
jgi:hypothetical protein